MTEFIQLHVLTSYPPANLNRDDLGRPKSAIFGGKNRLRISSQSLKRAWRQSAVFVEAVGSAKGVRTRELGHAWVFLPLVQAGVPEKLAEEAAKKIGEQFGKLDDQESSKKGAIKQLAHVSPEERAAIDALVEKIKAERAIPGDEEFQLLRHNQKAADIALFGRMLADAPSFNIEAAAQVSHAITVHPVTIQDDFFTAVDDLNTRQEDVGAGHMGETEFGAGIFYLYLCIDRDQLVRNLQGDEALAARTLRGLVEAVLTVAPSGKQNSFGSRAAASFAFAERGDRQPRSLSVAFLGNLDDKNYLASAIASLKGQAKKFDKVYGQMARASYELNVEGEEGKEGSLSELLQFVAAPVESAS
jgi:CRISPR system Cascade subunit CasC